MTSVGFEAVLDHLTAEILEGHVVAGDRLPNERELAVRLGTSRSAVREAIKVLQTQGVVASQTGPGGGTRVVAGQDRAIGRILKLHVALDAISFDELTETRVVLERAAAHAAAQQSDTTRLEVLSALYTQMEQTTESTAFNRLDTAFHVAIAGIGDNRLIQDMTVAIREAIAHRIEVAESKVPNWSEFRDLLNREHHSIAEALHNGDGDLAADRCEAHIRRAHHSLLR